jgi:hypothetical protein
MRRAESIALALVVALAGAVIVPYGLNVVGAGVMPWLTAAVCVSSAFATAVLYQPATALRGDAALVAATIVIAFATLLWLARPELLPPGGGPDLTHHLLLIDYIQQHGTLVRESNAGAAIGEMATYTPGMHALTVVAGRISQIDPFLVLYPLVAFTIALKFGVFALCLLRLLRSHPSRMPLTIGGVAMLFFLWIYTFGSVLIDSFLAQAVAELFAVAMWWALIAWDETPGWQPMLICAVAGTATFLTWPIWIGPPVLAAILLIVTREKTQAKQRLAYLIVGLAPIGIVAAVHTFNRTQGLRLVATSGAVSVPSLHDSGWWLLATGIAALVICWRSDARRPLIAFAAALAAQTMALWWTARQAGASTPYMAVKMMYLAIYPIVAAAMVAASILLRSRVWSAALALFVVVAATRQIAAMPPLRPTISRELWQAALWIRDRAPANCVDYLVGNEYTAYWLHLAVLRNPRADVRSTDDATYETQASFGRWLVDAGGPRYAIARLSILPRDIRDHVDIRHQSGDAVVLSRAGACPVIAPGD